MLLSEVVKVMEELAPPALAEPWDNVGLLVGDPSQEVSRCLLTIDYTAAVAREALELRCELVICYHPPIFEKIRRITAPSLVYQALRQGLAIYCPHTALDVAEGGTNDMLADALGLTDRRPLRRSASGPAQCKLVVFVPPEAADRVASALFAVGAGYIGNYSCCSFRSPGWGTFFGQPGSSPVVGQAGRLERVEELRLETILPVSRIEEAVRALRAAHPYEEPAFDLVQLHAPPSGRGLGRIGSLPVPIDRQEAIKRVKRELGLKQVLLAGPSCGSITLAAVGAGACGDLYAEALRLGAQLYLTGEIRHHDALRAAQQGMTVICTGHSNSERAVLKRVAQRLGERLPGLSAWLSESDRDPFEIV